MTLSHSVKKQSRSTMSDYTTELLQGCSDMSDTTHTPAHLNLFNVRSIRDSPEQFDAEGETFHYVTAMLCGHILTRQFTVGEVTSALFSPHQFYTHVLYVVQLPWCKLFHYFSSYLLTYSPPVSYCSPFLILIHFHSHFSLFSSLFLFLSSFLFPFSFTLYFHHRCIWVYGRWERVRALQVMVHY